MKNTLKTVGVIACIAVLAISLASNFWSFRKMGGLLDGFDEHKQEVQREFDLLEENIASSSTEYVVDTAEIEKIIGQLSAKSDEILDYLDELDVEPTIITRTVGRVEGETVVVRIDNLSQIPRTFTFQTADGMPVAYYDIVSIADGEYKLEAGTYDFEIVVNSIVATGDGPPAVVTEATISSSGTEEIYPVPIESSVTYYSNPDPMEFRWVDPHLVIGAFVGYDIIDEEPRVGADLGMSLMSYGNREQDVFRAIRFGAATDGRSGGITAVPIEYNLGRNIPLVEDLWIGPHIYLEGGTWETSVGITIGSTL